MLPPSPSRIQLFPRHEINSVATASASQFVTLLLVIMMVTIFSRLLELFLIVVKMIVISYTSNCTHSVSIVKIKVDFPFYILKANISIIFVCLYSLFITFISAFPDDIKVSSACRWSRAVFLFEYDGHCSHIEITLNCHQKADHIVDDCSKMWINGPKITYTSNNALPFLF